MTDIDPVYTEWLDLVMLVSERASPDGFRFWSFAVGTEGTTQERLERGRIAWARWGSLWGKRDA